MSDSSNYDPFRVNMNNMMNNYQCQQLTTFFSQQQNPQIFNSSNAQNSYVNLQNNIQHPSQNSYSQDFATQPQFNQNQPLSTIINQTNLLVNSPVPACPSNPNRNLHYDINYPTFSSNQNNELLNLDSRTNNLTNKILQKVNNFNNISFF